MFVFDHLNIRTFHGFPTVIFCGVCFWDPQTHIRHPATSLVVGVGIFIFCSGNLAESSWECHRSSLQTAECFEHSGASGEWEMGGWVISKSCHSAIFFRGHLNHGTHFFGWGDPKNVQMYGDVGGISLIKVFNSFLSHPKVVCSMWVLLQGKKSISQGKLLKSWCQSSKVVFV